MLVHEVHPPSMKYTLKDMFSSKSGHSLPSCDYVHNHEQVIHFICVQMNRHRASASRYYDGQSACSLDEGSGQGKCKLPLVRYGGEAAEVAP